MWIDSHAHLNDPRFEKDCDSVLSAAREGRVTEIIVVGYDLPSSRRAVELASKEPMVRAAVGIHPHDARLWNETTRIRLEELLSASQVVALGEIGLDYHYMHSGKEEQLRAFHEQLALARQYNKPVIIHNREAHQDTLNVLNGNSSLTGVMHCFSGSLEMARQIIKLGLKISFAGPLTFPNAGKLREIAAEIDLEHIMVETDCPYLTPHPLRGQRNEPARVGLVGQKLAEIKGMPVEKVAAVTTANCRELFGI